MEHVTLFTDLPPFRCSDDTITTQFTNDTFLMDSLCDDILEKANASPSQLHVMAIAIQSNVSMAIDAIQLCTPSKICLIHTHRATHDFFGLENELDLVVP